jgi:hypothetical protein
MSVRKMGCGKACDMVPRAFGVVIPVADGYLFAGGAGEDGVLVDSVEFFDVVAETVQRRDINLVKRVGAASVVFDDKTIIVGGRDSDGVALGDVEIVYRDGKVVRRSLPEGRYGMAAGRAGNKGIFFGGFDETGAISETVYLFDAKSDIVSTLNATLAPRAYAAAVSLPNGRLLILGGLGSDGRASGEIDLFDPAVGAICPVGQLRMDRWHHSAILLLDEKVLVLGGLTGVLPGQPTKTASILDPGYIRVSSDCKEMDQILVSKDAANTGSSHYLSSAVLTANGNVAVIGGLDGSHNALQQIEVYVPEE